MCGPPPSAAAAAAAAIQSSSGSETATAAAASASAGSYSGSNWSGGGGPTSTLQYTQSMEQPVPDIRNHPGYCRFIVFHSRVLCVTKNVRG